MNLYMHSPVNREILQMSIVLTSQQSSDLILDWRLNYLQRLFGLPLEKNVVTFFYVKKKQIFFSQTTVGGADLWFLGPQPGTSRSCKPCTRASESLGVLLLFPSLFTLVPQYIAWKQRQVCKRMSAGPYLTAQWDWVRIEPMTSTCMALSVR